MSRAQRQTRILGELSGESVSIETSGRVIRPAFELPATLVNELRLHVTEDGLELTAIDPANVGLVDMTIHAEAFESYAVDAADQFPIGLNVSGLQSRLSKARIGTETDDAVSLDIDTGRAIIDIEREYDGTTATFSEEMLTIDPDKIRQEPDIPSLDVPVETTISTRAFKAAVDHIDATSDHLTVRAEGSALVFAGAAHEDSDAEYGSAVTFPDSVPSDVESGTLSLFSTDYLTDMATGLQKAKVGEVTLEIGNEFPMTMLAEREINDTLAYEIQCSLAPRIGDS